MRKYRPNHKIRAKTPASRHYWSTNGQGGKQFPASHSVNLKEYWFDLAQIQNEHGPTAFLILPLHLMQVL